VRVLQELVHQQHTYKQRAEKVISLLTTPHQRRRIAIKCASRANEENQWGDFHFATSLAKALRRTGHIVRVDSRESWHCGLAESDDVVIVLRGLVPYEPRLHQKNIIWVISHPNDISTTELMKYDHIYVASAFHANKLSELEVLPLEVLPQCVDTNDFVFDERTVSSQSERILFVGNSRGIFRDAVRWSIERNLDIDVYGVGWESFISDSALKGQLIPNSVLGEVYASYRLVVCDHWADMKRLGYISNRVFDVLAVGGELAIDDVTGLDELIPSGIHVFGSADDLERICREFRPADIAKKRELASWAAKNHSFDARANTILAKIDELEGTL
jgi:hypothetical protein